ncbi:predicted protein [Chaetomium globosum CBS 148.51]|uniref:Uncharacterized protein n=1 Tax=Chaetomium globosum (strain ATCC 6205 / CBS 148.51 / DSM 1962 / NBRC 6347 / NRRL 1970) TaxID=306901 RepID=Q2GT41_CHAGB|nr:uncharacterized protein CHGG_08863 [Chaetomium globosum CBS 148.51]EAQ84849.1 predicted protein [Chaetomium globosum CBS 148.51]
MLRQWNKLGGLTTFEGKGQLSTRAEATKVENAMMTGGIYKTRGNSRLTHRFPGPSPVIAPNPNLTQKVQGWPCTAITKFNPTSRQWHRSSSESRDRLPLQLVKQGQPITGKQAQRQESSRKSNLPQGREDITSGEGRAGPGAAHAVQTPGGNKPPGTSTGERAGSVIVGSQGIGPDNQRQVKVRSDGWTPFFHPPLLPLLLSERLFPGYPHAPSPSSPHPPPAQPDNKPARFNTGTFPLPSLTGVDARRIGNVTGAGAAGSSPGFRENSKTSTAHGRVAKVWRGHARITHTAERPRLKRWAAPDSQGAKGNRRSRRRGGVVRDIGPGSQDAREACESR